MVLTTLGVLWALLPLVMSGHDDGTFLLQTGPQFWIQGGLDYDSSSAGQKSVDLLQMLKNTPVERKKTMEQKVRKAVVKFDELSTQLAFNTEEGAQKAVQTLGEALRLPGVTQGEEFLQLWAINDFLIQSFGWSKDQDSASWKCNDVTDDANAYLKDVFLMTPNEMKEKDDEAPPLWSVRIDHRIKEERKELEHKLADLPSKRDDQAKKLQEQEQRISRWQQDLVNNPKMNAASKENFEKKIADETVIKGQMEEQLAQFVKEIADTELPYKARIDEYKKEKEHKLEIVKKRRLHIVNNLPLEADKKIPRGGEELYFAYKGFEKATHYMIDVCMGLASDAEALSCAIDLEDFFMLKVFSRLAVLYEICKASYPDLDLTQDPEAIKDMFAQYYKDNFYLPFLTGLKGKGIATDKPVPPSKARKAFMNKGGVCRHWASAFVVLANAVNEAYKAIVVVNSPDYAQVTYEPHAFVRTNSPVSPNTCSFSDPMTARKEKYQNRVLYKSMDELGKLDNEKFQILPDDAKWNDCTEDTPRFIDPWLA